MVKWQAPPFVVAGTFEYTFPMLRREGVDVDSFGSAGEGRPAEGEQGRGRQGGSPGRLQWLASKRGATATMRSGHSRSARSARTRFRAAVRDAVGRNIDLVRRRPEGAQPIRGLIEALQGKVDGKLLSSL
jgi:Glu-tRNA(Gln) amidotransferase subunit E-like FAD-binding protein